MPGGNRYVCPDCNGWIVKDGRCVNCRGTGVNLDVSPAPSCRVCGGSGACVTCRGTGDIRAVQVDTSGKPQRNAYLGIAITLTAMAFIFEQILFGLIAIYFAVQAVIAHRRVSN